jgi:hypothetical protein
MKNEKFVFTGKTPTIEPVVGNMQVLSFFTFLLFFTLLLFIRVLFFFINIFTYFGKFCTITIVIYLSKHHHQYVGIEQESGRIIIFTEKKRS